MDFPQKYEASAEASTGLLFIKVYNKWHQQIKTRLKQLGITHPQFVVLTSLAYLSQSEDFISQSRLSNMAEIDVMTLSAMLKVLEKHGFIERFKNPKDPRANAVKLLEKGESIVKLAFPMVEDIDLDFFGVLGDQEAQFQKLLALLL